MVRLSINTIIAISIIVSITFDYAHGGGNYEILNYYYILF